MKKLILASLMMLTGLFAFAEELQLARYESSSPEIFFYKYPQGDPESRFTDVSPQFIVYPEKKYDIAGAQTFLKESGIEALVLEFNGSVYFINPIADKYDNVKDFEAYKNLMNELRMFANLKVIGIGAGATFVNATIGQHGGNLADIVSINGSVDKKAKGTYPPVPAYAAGENAAKVGAFYSKTLIGYEKEPLYGVVVNPKKGLTVKEYIDDAWDKLLCTHYRINNHYHSWFNGCNFEEFGLYEMEAYIMPEKMGYTRNVVHESIAGRGNSGQYLWYEYLPAGFENDAEASVPLLVFLHGNNADPRIQAETSGFVDIMAKEHFAIAELEWQGNGYGAAMGLDGIEQTVYFILNKYPQLDPSRVYVEGHSAGSMTASNLGIRKSHLFAAVGAHSGGISPARNGAVTPLMHEAIQKSVGIQTAYFSIGGYSDELVKWITPDNYKTNGYFGAWNIYAVMNGVKMPEKLDYNLDPVFGLQLSGRKTIGTSKDITMHLGDLCDGNGVPVIRILAIEDYGHWNFGPTAPLMWEYFKHFSRDQKTGELIYTEMQ